MSQLTEYGPSDTLVPSGLRGYRFWTNYNGRLLALHNKYIWTPGVNESECVLSGWKVGSHTFDPLCTCGFYARYSPDDLLDMNISLDRTVVGVIEATNRVAHGTRGFRAEKARILAICPVSNLLYPSRKTLPALAEYYEIDLFRNMEELVWRFPPDDVSAFVSHNTHEAWKELEKTLAKNLEYSTLLSWDWFKRELGINVTDNTIVSYSSSPTDPAIYEFAFRNGNATQYVTYNVDTYQLETRTNTTTSGGTTIQSYNVNYIYPRNSGV